MSSVRCIARPRAVSVRTGSRLTAALGIALTIGLAIGVAPGCGGPRLEPVGVSSYDAPLPASSSAAKPAAPAMWKRTAEVRTWPNANAKRFPSAGHWFGRFDADVRVSENARAAYAQVGPGRALPPSSVIALLLVGRDGTPGPVLAMERGEDGWTFVEAEADGRLVREGHLSPCAECHAHVAAQDSVFGVPTTGK